MLTEREIVDGHCDGRRQEQLTSSWAVEGLLRVESVQEGTSGSVTKMLEGIHLGSCRVQII